MEILFVRHGVPDYSLADARRMSQLEKDYAPLDRHYFNDIVATAEQLKSENAQVILCSPYTRALQTAEILNRQLGLELYVEHDLREWCADIKGGYLSLRERDRRWIEYREAIKFSLPHQDDSYESQRALRMRAEAVLARYRHFSKIIVVSHFNVYEALARSQQKGIACGQWRRLILNEAKAECV